MLPTSRLRPFYYYLGSNTCIYSFQHGKSYEQDYEFLKQAGVRADKFDLAN